MGIRINKKLGYSLTDVKENDERFNIQPYDIINAVLEDTEKMKEFVEHLYNLLHTKSDVVHDYGYRFSKNKEDKDQLLHKLYTRVTYDSEFGLESVLLFQPLWDYEEWSRYDDPIDYEERQSCEPTVTHKRWHCLYPFHAFTDLDGNYFGKLSSDGIRHINNVLDGRETMSENVLSYCSDGRFKTYNEWNENAFPIKPVSVVEFCKFFKIFKDEKDIYRMIPTIYTYWS